MLPMQEDWVPSLVGELKSHMLQGVAKKEKKKKNVMRKVLESQQQHSETRLQADTPQSKILCNGQSWLSIAIPNPRTGASFSMGFLQKAVFGKRRTSA